MKNFLNAPISNAIALLAVIALLLSTFLGGGGITAPGAPQGITTVSGPIRIGDGSASAPGYTWSSDTDTGLYRIGANNMGWSANGTLALDINSDGTVDYTGAQTYSGLLNANAGIAVDTSAFTVADTSGNTVIAGSLAANGGITADTNKFTVADATGNTVIAGSLAANGGISADTTAFTVADTTGNTVIAGTLTVTSTQSLVGVTTFTASPIMSSESITPTDGADITIVANLVTLTPGGATGNSLAACTTGKWAVLYNSISANVVITDTGNFIGAGNQTLGQFDTLPLVCIATKWVQTGPVSAN